MSAPGPEQLLRIYLRDHDAGAAAGEQLAQRAGRPAPDDAAAADLNDLAAEIADDHRLLNRVMAELGVSPSPSKQVLARLAECLGRFKPNGRVVRQSPLSAVIELEALLAGVAAKRRLWASLLTADLALTAADGAELRRRADRADRQLERLAEHHRHAAAAAFAAPRPGAELAD